MRDRKVSNHRGFTLVEILIVVVILSILGAIVIPQFADAGTDAKTSRLIADVAVVQKHVEMKRATTGSIPATIDVTWFADRRLPSHPQNDIGLAAIETVSTASLSHPANKVLKAGVSGAFWYNAAEGRFRARVADMGSDAATLALYNRVNNANETSLGNYGGGGGS